MRSQSSQELLSATYLALLKEQDPGLLSSKELETQHATQRRFVKLLNNKILGNNVALKVFTEHTQYYCEMLSNRFRIWSNTIM